jgi:hypothetical protein
MEDRMKSALYEITAALLIGAALILYTIWIGTSQ